MDLKEAAWEELKTVLISVAIMITGSAVIVSI